MVAASEAAGGPGVTLPRMSRCDLAKMTVESVVKNCLFCLTGIGPQYLFIQSQSKHYQIGSRIQRIQYYDPSANDPSHCRCSTTIKDAGDESSPG
jgi:hypothetical protein